MIAACCENDRQAQHQLYSQYCDAMYNTAVRMLGDSMEAQDALQEAFVAAFNNMKSFRGNSTFGAWLKKIVVHKCADLLKKRKMHLVQIQDFDAATENWEEQEAGISPEVIHEEIKQLPDKCRAVFSLYMLEGYDHVEIGEIMEISVSTSKSQLHRARHLLRERIKNY